MKKRKIEPLPLVLQDTVFEEEDTGLLLEKIKYAQ